MTLLGTLLLQYKVCIG